MEWIETASGNRISKQAHIHGSDHILIAGNTTVSAQVELKGDVRIVEGKTSIQIGKFVYLGENVRVVPPFLGNKMSSSKGIEVAVHKICKIGSYTMIGEDSVIKASNVGSRVMIGKGCTLQDSCVIHDCVVIKDNSYIPEHFNIPPFSLVFPQLDEYKEDITTTTTTTTTSTINELKDRPKPISIIPLPESYKKIIESYSKQSYINNQFTASEIP
ncbi:CYFA0S21e01816g1_1 [Cyberlindnera fabianii]|uniref:Dynactin subunit 5 n=1 Tax=Cyberlindnera fabianii TaxID=36022 RepID=A0A061BDV9_CYBFA|nr:CYFA0S21e01816g1_1 [Cyberlindnera fabianii]